MESIEKLRKMDEGMLVPLGNGQYVPDHSHNEIADEIEAEIAERYIELPVDVNGERWSVTDKQFIDEMGNIRELLGIEYDTNEQCWGLRYLESRYLDTFSPYGCRHVKPRTLEDVLRDVWKEAIDYAKSDIWRSPDEVFAERADEIRGLL